MRITKKLLTFDEKKDKIKHMEELNEKSIEDIIADNLTELRKSKKLKQSELAEQMGYSDKTVSRWENGSTVPDIATLARLAEFYGITVDDLLHENAVEIASDEAIQQKKKTTATSLPLCFWEYSPCG